MNLPYSTNPTATERNDSLKQSTELASQDLPTRSQTVINAFSIDVEDYFHVSAFEEKIDRSTWHQRRSRVFDNTMRLLELLDSHNTKATFFVLGWVAEKVPELIKTISAAGHEIGSHSHWHRLVYQLNPAEFRQDLRRSKDMLESIIQKPVSAFRAPSFSIVESSLWAFEVLVEEGFTADSSIFPSQHARNGINNFAPEIQEVKTQSGSIVEFPMPIARGVGRNVPFGGAGYFRLYPYWLTRQFIGRLNAAGQPIMFYTHPWEIDPEQPRVSDLFWSTRFKHYVNLKSTFDKLDQVLTDFQFATMDECINQWKTKTNQSP